MKRLSLLSMAIILVFSLTLAACGGTEQTSQQEPQNDDQNTSSQVNANDEQTEEKAVELEFYFPVSVGGAISEKIQSYVDEFNQQHEGKIKVKAVFSGDYTDTFTKAKTAAEAGNAPDVAILLQADYFDLTDLGLVAPLDEYIAKEGKDYINDFYPALLEGSVVDGSRYSIPFQRSTQVLFYNKQAFAEVGLDRAPETWDELVEYGKKLVKKENGEVTRWGLQVPMGGPFSYWNIQPFALQNGVELANPEGTKVNFNAPNNIEAVQFFYDLAHVHQIMPEGPQGWGDIPTNFLAGKSAMVIHSTGSLTNIKNKAEFDFGVAMLPTNGGKRTNLGGGNIYMFKDIPQENKDAAWELIKFLTSPEKAADWSMASGYIATRKSAYEVPEFKKFLEENPEYLVARDQLAEAGAELTTHNKGKVIKVFSDEIDAVITGQKTPEEAMKTAQEKAERELRGF